MIKHDPNSEGDFEWGTYTAAANQLAAICDSWRKYHDWTLRLYADWDKSMTASAEKGHLLSKHLASQKSLAWILENAGELFEDLQETFHNQVEDAEPLNPEEKRDFFCWLHRKFVYLKREEIGKWKHRCEELVKLVRPLLLYERDCEGDTVFPGYFDEEKQEVTEENPDIAALRYFIDRYDASNAGSPS